jgi:hypothetical protein
VYEPIILHVIKSRTVRSLVGKKHEKSFKFHSVFVWPSGLPKGEESSHFQVFFSRFFSANAKSKAQDPRFLTNPDQVATNAGLECGSAASNTASPRGPFEIQFVIFSIFRISGTPDERACCNWIFNWSLN